jgi:hypothetical protein
VFSIRARLCRRVRSFEIWPWSGMPARAPTAQSWSNAHHPGITSEHDQRVLIGVWMVGLSHIGAADGHPFSCKGRSCLIYGST